MLKEFINELNKVGLRRSPIGRLGKDQVRFLNFEINEDNKNSYKMTLASSKDVIAKLQKTNQNINNIISVKIGDNTEITCTINIIKNSFTLSECEYPESMLVKGVYIIKEVINN